MLDIIIKDGTIVDGSGASPYIADIGVKDGRIHSIGTLEDSAEIVINAKGLHVSPGFIDIHSHSDFSFIANPRAESKVRQGITSEVIGNCGDSAAPVLKDKLDLIKEKSEIDALEIQWDWLSMGDFMGKLDHQGIAVNVYPLIGHSTIRAAVMGYEQRAPSEKELSQMKDLIYQAMDEGAIGLSSGLIYAPGCYAETDELIELAKAVAEKKGFYASHIRDEGDHLISSVEEAIRIGKEAGLPVQLSHHKASAKSNWGKVKQSLALIDKANQSGADVMADQYPYTASSTDLISILPYWALEGEIEDILQRLSSEDTRDRLCRETVIRDGFYEDTFLSYCKRHPELEGKSLRNLAEIRQTDPLPAIFDLLIEERIHVSMVCFSMSEDDVREVMSHPLVMFGSDSKALAKYGVLSHGKPHPRNYGTFPRIIGKYVREEKVLTLEEAIRKMTSLPAKRLGLSDRGSIAKNKKADIVLFDFENVRDQSTFADPHQYPTGIEYVLVNGEIVIEKGEHTGKLPGNAGIKNHAN